MNWHILGMTSIPRSVGSSVLVSVKVYSEPSCIQIGRFNHFEFTQGVVNRVALNAPIRLSRLRG